MFTTKHIFRLVLCILGLSVFIVGFPYPSMFELKATVLLSSFLCTLCFLGILENVIGINDLKLSYHHLTVHRLHLFTRKEQLKLDILYLLRHLTVYFFIISLYQLGISFVYNTSNILFILLWLLLGFCYAVIRGAELSMEDRKRKQIIELVLENGKINGKYRQSNTIFEALLNVLPNRLQELLVSIDSDGKMDRLVFSDSSYYNNEPLYDLLLSLNQMFTCISTDNPIYSVEKREYERDLMKLCYREKKTGVKSDSIESETITANKF